MALRVLLLQLGLALADPQKPERITSGVTLTGAELSLVKEGYTDSSNERSEGALVGGVLHIGKFQR